jgi:alpha-beta hydrolase superfamily lysophospholipase
LNSKSFHFTGVNGQDIFTRYWNAPQNPQGILQIYHGMAEHAERYADFACHMNSIGFSVYACDLRGHGKTGELNHNSCDIDKDGFNGIVQDQHVLSKLIGIRNPGVPLFVLGHSFGAFIAQEYIKHYGSEIAGVILSGSCMLEGPAIKLGGCLAAISMPLGKSRRNALLDKLSFGSYNKVISNPVSKFAWISRDDEQVKKYDADSFCGNIMSTNFYYYFFKGLNRLNRNIGSIPKNLPVYLMSGDNDPVGQYGKGTTKLYEMYRSVGIADLQLKLYPGGRHEMLNETNRQEVYQDIAAWLQKHLCHTDGSTGMTPLNANQ